MTSMPLSSSQFAVSNGIASSLGEASIVAAWRCRYFAGEHDENRQAQPFIRGRATLRLVVDVAVVIAACRRVIGVAGELSRSRGPGIGMALRLEMT